MLLHDPVTTDGELRFHSNLSGRRWSIGVVEPLTPTSCKVNASGTSSAWLLTPHTTILQLSGRWRQQWYMEAMTRLFDSEEVLMWMRSCKVA